MSRTSFIIRTDNPMAAPENPGEAYHQLYDFPFHIDDWKQDGQVLIDIHLQGADYFTQVHADGYADEVAYQSQRFPLVRLWRWIRGTTVPQPPTRQQVIEAMVKRLNGMEGFVQRAQNMSFYMGSDLSFLAPKAKQVQAALQQELARLQQAEAPA